MDKTIAYTKTDAVYPGYFNITPIEGGGVIIYLRANPTKRNGAYVCGYLSDKGKHGRCTPGDDNCNNYCNMAPQKGKMQDRPKECEQVICGLTTSLVLSAEEWNKVKEQLNEA